LYESAAEAIRLLIDIHNPAMYDVFETFGSFCRFFPSNLKALTMTGGRP